jgi:GT2 family glycosyltransferase
VDDRDARPGLSVIVVNWNTRERLRDCLLSLERHLIPHLDCEVVVVDNASSDGSPEMVADQFPLVRLVRNESNVGFGRANNQAMRLAAGSWFLLLNSDTVLEDDTVAGLVTRLRGRSDIGVAQCRLILGDGRVQHTARRFPSVALALLEDLGLYKLMSRRRAADALLSGYWDHGDERDVDWVSGAFMLIPRRVFDVTGGFDERLFLYGEDLEWCYRIREKGWRIRYFPDATIRHFSHTSADLLLGTDRIALCLRRERDIFRDRHGPLRGLLFLAVKITGATLRTIYYTVRRFLGSRREDYRDMQTYAWRSLRALIRLALSSQRSAMARAIGE